MKQQIISLGTDSKTRTRRIDTIETILVNLDLHGKYEVCIRNETAGKTLRQLRGTFGHILKQVSDQTGEDVDYLHRKMKSKFLSHIYVEDPIGSFQEQWCELLAIYMDSGEQDKFERHAKRISLEWVTKSQMKRYMEEVINYWRNNGLSVSEPDRAMI